MHACNTNKSHIKTFHPGISNARTGSSIMLREHTGLNYKVIQSKCHIPEELVPHPNCCQTPNIHNFHPHHVHTITSAKCLTVNQLSKNVSGRFQASTTVKIRSSFFWAVTLCMVLPVY
jgi:hypothetical protein